MSKVPSHIHKLAASHCDSLLLSLPFIIDGHNAEKPNGALTYIEYRGRTFGITCAHVYEEQNKTGKWPTIHGSDHYIFQLIDTTSDGCESLFRPLRSGPNDNSFLLTSSLDADNKYFFSGMSDGPVYSVQNLKDNPNLIGIVFEGVPGSSTEWNARDESSFYTGRDIQIKAYTLTPEIFEQWLL